MNEIKKEVTAAIHETSVKAVELPYETGSNLLDSICLTYTEIAKYRFQMWDYLTDYSSVRDAAAWTWISDFIGNNEAVLFFEWNNEPSMFLFEDGRQIITVLAECHEFVFYVTGKKIEYLLCFNDHDYLLACGSAKEWLTLFTAK